MKRLVVLLACVCALALALAVAPAFAGPPKPGGIMIPEASNTAVLSNDPVLSGNSVALVNTGDQSSSASPTLIQQNGNAGSQPPSPGGTNDDAQPASSPNGPNGPDGNQGGGSSESNTAVLSNDPVLSGNSVAGVNGGGCTCDSGSQTSSADPTLVQQNGGQGGDSKGGGEQNVAILSNDPVASGNSVALVNTGDQTSSADPTLIQQNAGGQGGEPDHQQGYSKSDCRCEGSQGDSKGSGEKNVAVLSNDPVASGNSVALVNTGDQTSSADPTLIQQNGGQQSGKPDGWKSKSKGGGEQNVAVLSNDPVASGNSVALVNTGDQTSSADPTLIQQNGGQQGGKPEGKSDGQDAQQQKPCPKPEPKPCPEPKPAPCHPKPCPPKPCPEPKPAPCHPKPCPPKPCKQGGGSVELVGALI